MQQIAVDLTPILPGGDNGGAKIMTFNLIKQIAHLAPFYHFYLLSNNKNYHDIKQLQTSNVHVINTDLHTSFFLNCMNRLFYSVIKFLRPRVLQTYLITVYQRISKSIAINSLCKRISCVDLLFSPFTAPFFYALKVPNISIIYDLQYQYYPFFFTSYDRNQRKKTFNDACKYSTKLVTISDFVKQTVVENSKFPAEHIKTIHITLSKRLPPVEHNELHQVLKEWGLIKEKYLLYPANFWAHKNHKMLFTAFNIYRHQYPHSILKLVCTGTHEAEKNKLIEMVKLLGLSEWIIMPGYLPDNSFAALMESSLAIIYPSLYEGFGMPILEAMNMGKPVICSNVASLPEIAGDAALFFDPRKPDDIVQAIFRIENEPDLAQTLIQKGQYHVANFGNENTMANEYLKLFHEVLAKKN